MDYSLIMTMLLGVLILVTYYVMPGRFQNVLLLVVSYAFAIAWNWHFALLLFFATFFHYKYAFLLSKNRRKTILVVGISINVLLLLLYRSADFFIPQLVEIFHRLGINSDSLKIIIPVGLSYYTLQNISYLVDIYRRQTSPVTNFISFALYLAYFPKLVAGPIENARTFIPNLEKSRTIGNEELSKSTILILTGLIRKFVIADSLSAAIPSEIFNTPNYFSPFDLFGWLIVFAFVIYNDFAGYTSIARGVSSLFGIELSNNFEFPYFARSFSEFWNRWHITLSHWLRDYIYFPLYRTLSKVRPGQATLLGIFAPPLVTMLVSGLWHGLSWHMIVWGGLHGLYQALERLTTLGKPIVSPDQKPVWWQISSNVIIFLLVVLAWVPFKMELPTATLYWLSMFNLANLGGISKKLVLIILYLGFWTIVEWQMYRRKDEFLCLKFPAWVKGSLFAGAVVLIIIATSNQAETTFIYQGF